MHSAGSGKPNMPEGCPAAAAPPIVGFVDFAVPRCLLQLARSEPLSSAARGAAPSNSSDKTTCVGVARPIAY